ncbi:ABC transporter permease [Candidatus Contubernalis alkaliaceticus]|uniref:ABC transporter permease n=1 Tax=Candidatus Contubernalis alkaliaceticus TaxID=338645 RepID=UPI001F4BF984|nr:ABC transporter permease [Candidatus Contubernalis alkalaceticus]UNC93073.1 ABC transporter permease [Candidatus Contubernalis alkalaceticus]
MKIFGHLFIATLKDMVRDKMTIFWFLLFPVLFIILFGFIFSGDTQNIDINLGVVVEQDSVLTEAFVENLNQAPALTLYQGTLDDELEALENGERSIVLVLPEEISSLSPMAEGIIIPVYYDASQQTTNHIMLSVIREIFDESERQIQQRPRLFSIDAQPVQTEPLKDIDFLLPGIIAMALMQLGLFGSLRLVSLREKKILKSLGATPLPRTHLVLSEVAVRLLMAVVQTVLIILIGHLVFGVTIIGSWWKVLGVILLGAATFVSLGYMLVSFSKTEESGMGIIQVVQFPMMFLSGIFFPLNFLPEFLEPVVKAIPLSYLGDLLRNVMVGIPSEFGLTTNLLVLCGWLFISLSAAIRFWRWE